MNNPTNNTGEDIAVIGMSGRFPGAQDIDTFWHNLSQGVESISFFSDEELARAGVDVATLSPDYVRAGAILKDPEWFDASFFGYGPREAEMMDPQQRVFLEIAWEALENAGYDSERYAGAIGVYAGAGHNGYFLANLSGQHLLEQMGGYAIFLARDGDFLATRVAYKLNLRGPAMTVQTACSTSLVAVCQACQSLLAYQCDMALAGGVSIDFPQTKGHLHVEDAILSPDGHCRPFDARAHGTVAGQGAGVVVLKRLADAVQDGDHIFAVVKGFAVNNDGSLKVGYTAPSVDGQAEVIALAQAVAGISPDTISYIEAHGTATPLGDPIEIAALTKAFRAGTTATGFCAIGSVKSNLGHLNAAAGIAGFLKTVLALQHRQLPPSLHFATPNPKIPFAASPFYVNDKLAEWKAGPTPRRAGVSSFGLGGTNAHVVLEEAPAVTPSGGSRSWQLILLSARTGPALDAATTNLAAHFKNRTGLNLADAAFTLQVGRHTLAHRRILVVRDLPEATRLLETRDPKRVLTQSSTDRDAPVVFLFPGQGAQQVNMGRELYHNEPVFRQTVDHCADILQPLLDLDLRQVLYPAEADAAAAAQQLTQTRLTQPALFVVEYALAQQWMAWGVRPEAMLGHSVGEYVAACLAGVFSLEDALTLVASRARLMQELPGGSMLAIRLPEAELRPLLGDELSLSTVNAPGLCVASGPTEAVQALYDRLRERGVAAKVLATSHAFHSAMMDPLAAPFTELVRKTKRNSPQIPYLSNVTGAWITAAEIADPGYWFNHLRQTVRFADGIQELAKDPHRILLEVGPGHTLAALARQHPARAKEQLVVASLCPEQYEESDLASVLTALGRLWQAGVTVDWMGFHADKKRQRIPLPSYPFERKRYWIEPIRTQVQMAPANDSQEPHLHAKVIAPSLSAPVQPTASLDRTERILSALKTVVHELSGINLADIDPSATFTEMGFDSLFLTQASVAFQNKCGVKIRFRQLLEDLSTLRDLARYVDQQLPADATVTASPVAAAPVAIPTATPAVPTLAEIAQQLQSMQQQLEMLRRSPNNPPPVAPPQSEPESFGPFKPARQADHAGLTTQQKKFLEEFITRYNQRTAESKRLTQLHRTSLADPRSVTGFHQAWKEIVYPLVSARSAGSKIWDVDGNEYVDLTMGFGANLFGHSPSFVAEAMAEQLKLGIAIGPQSPLAGEVAQLLCTMTGQERVTFCNTGSEAVMAAIRVARTVTGRDKIVYFTGAYHGVFDEVLGRANPVAGAHRAAPIAPGIPRENLGQVLILEYGAPESLKVIQEHGNELAAVLVEPVQSRRPEFQPREFLHELRRITQATGTALIFDEMVTGFRVHPGGIQGLYGIQADLATYGKILGGGLPIGILTGKRAYMDALDGGDWRYGDASEPEVGVTFFAGTFVRHPLALAAARAVLHHLQSSGPVLQEQLNEKTSRLVASLNAHCAAVHAPVELVHFGSWFIIRLPEGQPQAGLLLYLLRHKGIHVQEQRPCYLTTAHSDDDLAKIVVAFKESIAEMQSAGLLPRTADSSTSAPAPAPTGDNGDGRKTFAAPVTEAQAEIWLATQMGDEASCAYNESYNLTMRGALNLNALERAVQEVVERHDALRTTFALDGTQQIISDRLKLAVPFVDLSLLPQTSRDQQLPELMAAEVKTPFDLVRGPLLRVKVVKLEEQLHRFLLTVHHIICDGFSIRIILRELSTLYTAHCQATAPALKKPMQYSEFTLWQSRQQQRPEMAAVEAYWLQQYAGPIPLLDLPADHPRPPLRSYKGAGERIEISAKTLQDLKRLATQHNCTLFATLLTGFNLLLHRLTGQSNVVVGVPATGQLLVGATNLVGHCVNLLPMRDRIDENQTVSDHLAAVKKMVLDAFDHQDYTFGTLIRKLQIPRDSSRSPLLSVVFNVDRAGAPLNFAGLSVETEPNPVQFAKFDLLLNVIDADTRLVVECTYNSVLFDRPTIQRWLGHFQTLLEAVVAAPDSPVGALPLLTEAERRRLIVEWNDTALAYPHAQTIPALLEAQVARTPSALALVAAGQQLTYAELNARANQLASHLRTGGVGPETLVGICLERNVEMVVALLAVLKAGGAYVPLDPAYPPQRMAIILEDAGVQVLLTSTALLPRLPAQTGQVVCLDTLDLSAACRDNLAPVAEPHHLAYVIFTSGSTGRPKGVAIEHRSTVAFIEWARTVFTPSELASVIFSTSICFDVSVFELLVPLCCGGTVVLTENALHLPANGCTLFSTVPSVMSELLNTVTLPTSVRTVCLAGEPLPQSLVEKLYALPHVEKVYDLYGPTEDTTYSTFALRRPGGRATIGRPIANTQVYLLDARLQPVPVGVAGELHLGGAGLARGYLDRPEMTGEKFISDPFRTEPGARLYKTGDLARYLPDGNIEYLGRLDRQVKIRGFRIELGEIEALLGTHTTVGQAVVVAREDTPGDRRLVAYVVSANGVEPVPATLREWLRAKLPEYMVPAAVVVLAALPLTVNGKVDRRALPAPERQSSQPDHEFVAPRDPLELQLARLWEKIFNRQPIGVRDNFFELGGHSLLAVRLFAQIQKLTGRNLPLATLFQAPTIEQLAQVLKKEGWQPPWQCLVPIKPGGSLSPFYCVHGVGGNILEFLDLAKYLPDDQPFYGIQAMGLDGKRSRQTLTVEEMAAHYIGEIRALQTTGPYYFGGSSFGGMVAYEMAQQLVAQGEQVGLLALFDTNGPGYPRYLSNATVWQRMIDRFSHRVSLHWENFRAAQGKERLTYLRVKTKKLGHGIVAGSQRRLWRSWLRTRQYVERLWLPSAIRQVHRVGHWAAEDYCPKPYPGRATLFRATIQPPHIVEDRTLGWSTLVLGGLEIYDTPGHHGAIVRDPRARVLAQQLQDGLKQAREQMAAPALGPQPRNVAHAFADAQL